MKKTIIRFMLFILIMTGCGDKSEIKLSANDVKDPYEKFDEPELVQTSEDKQRNQLSEEETDIAQLPDSVDLSFTPLEFKPLETVDKKNSWEPIQSFSLGAIKEKSITLQVLNETDENSVCSASYQTVSLIEFDGSTFQIPGCTSSSLKKDDLEKGNAVYRLMQYQFNENQKQIIVAGVELAANGPGRTLYIVYDQNEKKLFSFEDWGVPLVIDLDNSGDLEFVNQFTGLHTHFPDVTVYRWVDGYIEKSLDLKKALGINNHSQNEVLLESKEDYYMFEVICLTDLQTQTYESVMFKYENGKLRKIK